MYKSNAEGYARGGERMLIVNFRGCELQRKSWTGWGYTMWRDDHCAFSRSLSMERDGRERRAPVT